MQRRGLVSAGMPGRRSAVGARRPTSAPFVNLVTIGPAIARGRTNSLPGNLPVELTSFVGRTRELLEIRRLLAVAHTVTLTGLGGIGKTRLALRAAHQLARHFPDGVWWVELGELETGDLVVDALAHALEVSERPGAGVEASVLAHLRDRRPLIVFDNCEHLVDACRALVSTLVSRNENVRVLCTSRQRLGVPGESIVVVSPLAVPAATERSSVGAVSEVDAVSLLIDRARVLVPDFVVTDDNFGAVTEICERLDGLPLAIELAAVRLASLAPADLLDRLDDRFRLLTTERDHQSRRHQALRAAVEWSHDLLGVEEQVLWRRCSVFAGSFGIDAAEAVCSADGLDRDRIVDLDRESRRQLDPDDGARGAARGTGCSRRCGCTARNDCEARGRSSSSGSVMRRGTRRSFRPAIARGGVLRVRPT